MPGSANTNRSYQLTFPSDLKADQVATWLRAVSGTLRTGPRRLLGVSSIVFEVEASEAGIIHRLVVPEETGDFVVSQLRSLIPGSTATPAGAYEPHHQWTAAVELGQTNSRMSLGTVDAEALSASILTNMQGLSRSEALLIQWVVSPALRERPPQQREERIVPGAPGRLLGGRNNRDQITERRTKLSEPNFLGVLPGSLA